MILLVFFWYEYLPVLVWMFNLIIIISMKLRTSIGIGIPCYPGNIQHNQFSLDAIDVISITSKLLQYVVDGVICPKSEEKHWLVILETNLKNFPIFFIYFYFALFRMP